MFHGRLQGTRHSPKLMVIQWYDIVIYNKNDIFAFVSISGTELPKPLEFPQQLEHKSVCCYLNEATFRKHRRMGAGCRKNQPCDQKVRASSLILLSRQIVSELSLIVGNPAGVRELLSCVGNHTPSRNWGHKPFKQFDRDSLTTKNCLAVPGKPR